MKYIMKYIPPVFRYKGRLPRKYKKQLIKEFGRDFYHDLRNTDLWIENGLLAQLMPEAYEKEMLNRKNELREKKLEKLCQK
jgi:hypothetical protein